MSFVILGVVLAVAIAYVLANTRAWWVMGALLLVGAIAIGASIETPHGDVGGLGALGNGVMALGAIGLVVVALLVLAVGRLGGSKPTKPDTTTSTEAVELAKATVVNDTPRA